MGWWGGSLSEVESGSIYFSALSGTVDSRYIQMTQTGKPVVKLDRRKVDSIVQQLSYSRSQVQDFSIDSIVNVSQDYLF